MSAAGVKRQLKVLYASDYVGWALKQLLSGRLALEVRGLLPHMEVDYCTVEGPYEDDQGDGAYFSGGNHKLDERRLKLEVRRDVFVPLAKILRTAHLLKTAVLIADGQAGPVACCTTQPLIVELALAARVIQHE